MDGTGWPEPESESESRLPSLDIPPQLASRKPNNATTRSLKAQALAGPLSASKIILPPAVPSNIAALYDSIQSFAGSLSAAHSLVHGNLG
jgi:hypothetical protein